MDEPLPSALSLRHDLRLVAEGVSAMRGGRPVVAGVGFTIGPGEALMLKGPNGAGKTSILRAVAGLSRPAEGTFHFHYGQAPADAAEVRALDTHWIGGEDGLADKLSVIETVSFWSALLGGGDTGPPLLRTGLSALGRRRVGALSTGQRRRLGLCRLLVAPRALWLMDEPHNGLDAAGRALLGEIVDTHRAEGGAVLMASHDETLPGASQLTLAAAA